MASGFNQCQIIGNFTRDPEVKYTQGGTAICEMTIATTRTWFDKNANEKKESTVFLDVVFWGKKAELVGEYLSKGSSLFVTGYLEQDNWEDKETGKKRSKLKLVCDELRFLGKSEKSSGEPRQERSAPKGGSRLREPDESADVPF